MGIRGRIPLMVAVLAALALGAFARSSYVQGQSSGFNAPDFASAGAPTLVTQQALVTGAAGLTSQACVFPQTVSDFAANAVGSMPTTFAGGTLSYPSGFVSGIVMGWRT